MNHSLFIASLLVVVCVIRGVCSENQKPNIIFILADDLGWNDVGYHGSNQIPTPNIDALAYAGLILDGHYMMPMCSPSRSSLMTGRHTAHTGMYTGVIHAPEPWGLGLEEKLLPEYLKENGYATHMVGKWHLGFYRSEYTPTFRGFDSHFGYWTGKLDYWNHTHLSPGHQFEGHDVRRGLENVYNTEGDYFTHVLTREAVKVVHEHDSSQPLFLYLAHLATHAANDYDPLQAPQETIDRFSYIDHYGRRVFAAMASELDKSVGELVAALGERGMLENSIIVFSGDNGGPAGGFNSNWASNWPLRGRKSTAWEGGVRCPTIMWSPLLKSPPRVSRQLMHVSDWLPTLLEAIGDPVDGPSPLAGSPPLPLDGMSVWRGLSLEPDLAMRTEILVHLDPLNQRLAAIRWGKWKLLLGTTNNGEWDSIYEPSGRDGLYNFSEVQTSLTARALAATSRPLPSDDLLLALRQQATLKCNLERTNSSCNPLLGHPCLFDLEVDPCEDIDLAKVFPEVVAELLQALNDHARTLVPPRYRPADPQSNPALYNGTWESWYDYTHPAHPRPVAPVR